MEHLLEDVSQVLAAIRLQVVGHIQGQLDAVMSRGEGLVQELEAELTQLTDRRALLEVQAVSQDHIGFLQVSPTPVLSLHGQKVTSRWVMRAPKAVQVGNEFKGVFQKKCQCLPRDDPNLSPATPTSTAASAVAPPPSASLLLHSDSVPAAAFPSDSSASSFPDCSSSSSPRLLLRLSLPIRFCGSSSFC